jgi:hypothetical protein
MCFNIFSNNLKRNVNQLFLLFFRLFVDVLVMEIEIQLDLNVVLIHDAIKLLVNYLLIMNQ